MITVQGPLWAIGIGAALWFVILELQLHVREFRKDREFNRRRREHGRMPETWEPNALARRQGKGS